MSNLELISNKLLKNFFKAFKTIKFICLTKKQTIICLDDFTRIPRDNDVYKHINKITSEILRIELIHDNFSDKYILKEVLSILETIIIFNGFNLQRQEFNEICKNLIQNLEIKINDLIDNEFDNFEFIFHINNIKSIPNMKLGNVMLFKAKEIEEYIDEFDKLGINNDYIHKDKFYAKTTIYGSKEYAVRKAESNIRIALNLLKLFLPEHYCNFNIDGDNYVLVDRRYIQKSSNNVHFNRKWINFSYPCEISKKELRNIYIDLGYLCSLINSKNRTDFENRLLTSIYWLGESLSIPTHVYDEKIDNEYNNNFDNLEYFDVYPKLLNITVALETLFVFNRENIEESISSKTAALIAKPEFKEFIENFIKDMYDNRSKLVHAGNVYISEDELNALIYYARLAILEVVQINRNYSDKIAYLNKYYSKI